MNKDTYKINEPRQRWCSDAALTNSLADKEQSVMADSKHSLRSFSEQHRKSMSTAATARCTTEWRRSVADRLRTQIDDQRLRKLYESGKTQTECATELGVSQKVIWKAMKRLGIKARVAAKRNQRGSANSSWQGDGATYAALHKRVEVERGKPSQCEKCGTTSGRFEWANISGNYTDVSDYERLCVSCHRKHDSARRQKSGSTLSSHVSRKRKEAMS